MPDQTPNAPADDGVALRPMTPADLPFTHAMTDLLRWPHRLADWEQVFAHAEGVVAERDGRDRHPRAAGVRGLLEAPG